MTNIRPVQIEKVDWPWKNKINEQGIPQVFESPGYVDFPDRFIECFDFDRIEQQTRFTYNVYTVSCDMKSIFTTYLRFMGTGKGLIDIIECPYNVTLDLFEIQSRFYEWNDRFLSKWAKYIDFFIIGDDVGTSTSLLISPEMIDLYLMPYWANLARLAKKHGVEPYFHSDGAIGPILEDLVHAGFEGIFVPKAVMFEGAYYIPSGKEELGSQVPAELEVYHTTEELERHPGYETKGTKF